MCAELDVSLWLHNVLQTIPTLSIPNSLIFQAPEKASATAFCCFWNSCFSRNEVNQRPCVWLCAWEWSVSRMARTYGITMHSRPVYLWKQASIDVVWVCVNYIRAIAPASVSVLLHCNCTLPSSNDSPAVQWDADANDSQTGDVQKREQQPTQSMSLACWQHRMHNIYNT